jgi:hypothetical protein
LSIILVKKRVTPDNNFTMYIILIFIFGYNRHIWWSHWQRCLRRRSASARLLGLRVRIPPVHGCLSLVCCQVAVSATGWSLLQRSPTDCGVSECHREASMMEKLWPALCRKGGNRDSSHFFVLLSFPHCPRHSWAVRQMLGRAFLLPVDASPCPVLPATLLQLFLPNDRPYICDGPRFCIGSINWWQSLGAECSKGL